MALPRSSDRVLDEIRACGAEVSAARLAGLTGLSLSTVRFHLANLLAQGLVRAVTEVVTGPGRPKLRYRAVPAAAVDAAAAYQLLAELLAEQLANGAGTPERAGARWAETLLERAGRATGLSADPIESVLTLLRDCGFDPERDATRRVVVLRRCPFAQMVSTHAQVVCGVHASLVAAVLAQLGAPAKVTLRASKMLRRPCEVRIQLGVDPDVRLLVL